MAEQRKQRDPGRTPKARPKPRPVAQTGRVLGPRALKTRTRILDATEELLTERSALDLPVVDIARRAGTSPATFYHYFRDVEEVALALAERAAEEMPAVLPLIEGDWSAPDALDRARRVVEAFFTHWDRHHATLTLRNMNSDRGDRRFVRVRGESIIPVLDALAAGVKRGQAAGCVDRDLHAMATAIALASMLERMAAHHRELGGFGVNRDDVLESAARILVQTLGGGAAG